MLRPLLNLSWNIQDSPPGQVVAPLTTASRPEHGLYDLRIDPTEPNNLLTANHLETQTRSRPI
ncbi:hypothetical protein [Mycobacterium uberis]|uniref:hypothetical protein n=1 Tax=Mycobacterium uberis TaxID=2162698 RepID=UPI001A9E1D25|nr:hypothetical protein [Mycobacterium uberis]